MPRAIRILALLALPALLAQGVAAATLTGRVTSSATAAAVRGARVLLFDGPLSIFVETRTNAVGVYVLEAPAGTYTAAASSRDMSYVEAPVTLGAVPSALDFALGPETEPGAWTMVGDTDPEELAASNSGSLLADGTTLFCHSTRDPIHFDPVTYVKSFPPDSNDFQGCSAVTLLGDGRLLFIGGQRSLLFTDATDRVKSFNSWTRSWWIEPSLNQERWYPGLARLADGELLVCGGGQSPAAARTDTCERRDPSGGWVPTASMGQPSEYSPMALLHTGEVLKTWFPPELYHPVTRTWRATSATAQAAERAALYPDHCDHSMTVRSNGEAIIVGVRPTAATLDPVMAEHYDLCAGTWRLGGDQVIARSRPEVAPLPDGRIFMTAGKLEETAPAVFRNAWGYVRLADLYDPRSERWRPVAEMRVAREYHATTILLPDGRVLTTGGTGQPGNTNSPDMGIDVFAPPYLFRGPRPRIDALGSSTLRNGEWTTLDVSLAPAVTSVVMIGTQAVTHYVDGAIPRRLLLPFRQDGTRLDVKVPTSPLAAMEGWYLLFVMVDDVPSEGRLVRVLRLGATAIPDSIGNALRAVKSGDDAIFDWREGPLNPTRYNLHRTAIKAAVAPTPAGIGSVAVLARIDEEQWVEPGSVAGPGPVAFYQVLGRSCDGTSAYP